MQSCMCTGHTFISRSSVASIVVRCVCVHSRRAEQWGRACWLIKVYLNNYSWLPLSLWAPRIHHTVWHSTPSMVTGRPGMHRRNLGCQCAPPYTPTTIISLTHSSPLSVPPGLSSSSPTHPWLWSTSPRGLQFSPVLLIVTPPPPPHLCQHTIGSESCLLATNPSEKVAVVLKRLHMSGRERREERVRQWER